MDTVNLEEKFKLFNEYWSPKVVGEINEMHVKLVKAKGEFTWHHHDNEDELFLVVKGTLKIKLPDRELVIREGEFAIIPKGVEHMPVAEEEVYIVLLEPKSALNTGNVRSERTLAELERI